MQMDDVLITYYKICSSTVGVAKEILLFHRKYVGLYDDEQRQALTVALR